MTTSLPNPAEQANPVSQQDAQHAARDSRDASANTYELPHDTRREADEFGDHMPYYQRGRAWAKTVATTAAQLLGHRLEPARASQIEADRLLGPLINTNDPEELREFIAGAANQAEAHLNGLAEQRGPMELLAPFWTEEEAREALRLTTDAMASRRAEGSVLALTSTEGERFYPVSQFQRHGDTVEVTPALLPFFAALRQIGPWGIGALLYTPAGELDGLTPLAWVEGGHPPEALNRLAREVARKWANGAT